MERNRMILNNRQSIRLKGYDYSKAGAYFFTVCSANRQCIFGEIVDNEMKLNKIGKIVKQSWDDIPNHYQNIELDCFIIMPNHVHGIINIINVGAGLKPAPTTFKNHGLPEIIRGFKTFSSRRTNFLQNTVGNHLWQRNYYEHIIRNEKE